jgi:hypothetical protein
MKRIATALGILAIATIIGAASAAEMPKQLRDTWWCADRPGWGLRTYSPWPAGNYKRCLVVTDGDDAFKVDASGREWFHDMTDEACKVLRVTSYKDHLVVRARCKGEEQSKLRVLLRWRLKGGNRLEIRDANNAMQARFVGEWCRISGSVDVPNDQLQFNVSVGGKRAH